jgi:tellurite resistance protein
MSDDKNFIQDFDDPKLQALLETMVLAAYADGEFSPEEQVHFAKSVESLTDGKLAGEKLETLLARVLSEWKNEGREARLVSVKERLPTAAARKVALSLAIQVTASDGIIRTSERELICDMAEALDIDRDEAADLVAKLTR